MQYNLNDIKRIVAELQAKCEPDGTLVVGGFTALVVHGYMASTASVSLDVSSRAFRDLAEGLSTANVQRVNGTRWCSPIPDVYVREGIQLGDVLVGGIRTYSIAGIKARAELLATRPGHLGWGDACVTLSVIQAHERKVEKAAERRAAEEETRLKVATNRQEIEEGFLKGADQQLVEFIDRCKRADWYYSYSDDLTAYRRGKEVCTELEATARTKGGVYKEVYAHYSTR